MKADPGWKHIPSQVLLRVIRARKIPRWEGEIWKDSAGARIVRCVEMAESLPMEPLAKEKVKLILVLANLPAEWVAERDAAWRTEMETAGRVITGVAKQKIGFEPAVAKLIEMTDEHCEWHRQLIEWAGGTKYDPAMFPEGIKLVYTWDWLTLVAETLRETPVTEDYEETALMLIGRAKAWTRDAWKRVPAERIPKRWLEELVRDR